jgi:hypothetical protein
VFILEVESPTSFSQKVMKKGKKGADVETLDPDTKVRSE